MRTNLRHKLKVFIFTKFAFLIFGRYFRSIRLQHSMKTFLYKKTGCECVALNSLCKKKMWQKRIEQDIFEHMRQLNFFVRMNFQHSIKSMDNLNKNRIMLSRQRQLFKNRNVVPTLCLLKKV